MELGDAGNGIRITHWSLEATENVNAIDITEEVLLRACNAKSVDHAVALLQVAASMEAVSLLIMHNPFDARGGGSSLRAFPLVNVAKMVEKFDTSKFDSKCQVNTGYEYHDGEGVGGQPIYLQVNVAPTYTDANQDLSTPCKDFPLLMPGFSADKMYACKINLFPNTEAEPPKEAVSGVLAFYLNASKRSASAGLSTAGGVKRKLSSMQWT
jgi:hypothetical protein